MAKLTHPFFTECVNSYDSLNVSIITLEITNALMFLRVRCMKCFFLSWKIGFNPVPAPLQALNLCRFSKGRVSSATRHGYPEAIRWPINRLGQFTHLLVSRLSSHHPVHTILFACSPQFEICSLVFCEVAEIRLKYQNWDGLSFLMVLSDSLLIIAP